MIQILSMLLTITGNDSGNRTLYIICNGVAPIERAASISPLGTSNNAFSIIRAINGEHQYLMEPPLLVYR